jgi:hypothetical protein
VVFVDEAAEEVAALDRRGRRRDDVTARIGWCELERSVRSLRVVVGEVGAEGVLEVAAADDQEPVEALVSDRADEGLRVGVRLRCADRCVDDVMSSLRKTSSKAALNLLSRSWIR